MQKEQSTLLLVLLAVILTSFIVGGGVYWWQTKSFRKLKEEIKEEIGKKGMAAVTPTLALPSPSPTPAPTGKYEGWLTYTNSRYRYQFKYPPGAKVEEVKKEAFSLSPEEASAGVTFEDKYRKYTGQICVTISYKLGYVQISAPPNKGFAHVLCGRTGRAYEGPERSEELVIDGKTYTAKGFEERGPGETLNFHNETLVVTFGDGTRIEYGSQPDERFTFADYQAFRDEILKIVTSYKRI